METTPGYRTSEYWISLFAVLVGAFLASGAFAPDSVWMKLAGLLATILGALGYTVSRTMLKSTAAKAEALKSLPPR